MKKKVLSTLLAAVMLLTMFVSTFTAFAANESYGYKVDSAVSGNKLVVTVTLPGNVKAAGGNFNLRYNTDNLTFSKYDSLFPGMSHINPNLTPNTIRATFANATAYTTDTVIVKVTFDIKNGKVSKDDVKMVDYNLFNEDAETIVTEKDGKTEVNFTCPHAKTTEIVTKQPTCTASGSKNIVCTICGEVIRTEAIKATGHNFGSWKVITPATCTQKGVETRECACGEKETREIPLKPHTPGEWTVKTAPTCTKSGVEVKKCTVCGAELETRVIPAKGHTPGEWTVTKEPTCTEKGERITECKTCGEKYTEEIAALGHTADKWEIVKEATCTEAGEKKAVCTVCGEEFTETIAALGHKFGEWTVVKEATEAEEGLKERICSVCGEKETEVIPKIAVKPTEPADNEPEIPNTTGTASTYIVIGVACVMLVSGLSAAAIVYKKKKRAQ